MASMSPVPQTEAFRLVLTTIFNTSQSGGWLLSVSTLCFKPYSHSFEKGENFVIAIDNLLVYGAWHIYTGKYLYFIFTNSSFYPF